MGKIIQFRPRGKEADSQMSPQAGLRVERPVFDAIVSAVHFPSWKEVFNDAVVTINDTPVAMVRAALDTDTIEGKAARIALEQCLLIARARFFANSGLPERIKKKATIKLAKQSIAIGLELDEQSMQATGRNVLVSIVGTEKAQRVIENIQIMHRVLQKR